MPGKQRSRVAVLAEPEEHEIETGNSLRGGRGEGGERSAHVGFIALRGVRLVHGDAVDVLRRDRDVAQQRVEGRFVVPIRMARGHAPLVAEEDLRGVPVHLRSDQRCRQKAVTREGRRPPCEGDEELSSFGDGLGREVHEEKRRRVRDIVRRAERENLPHGLRQRLPSLASSATDASGPQVPAS